MAGPSETPKYIPPMAMSQAQFVFPYGVPHWAMEAGNTDEFSLTTQRPQLTTSGSHGRAGPPPSNRAAAGGW